MLNKNDEIIEYVVDTGSNGEGIVKHENFVVFVPFAIKGEKIKVKILKVSKNIAYGKILEVIEKSEFRIDELCPVYNKCGGCNLQHVTYEFENDFKKNTVKNSFLKIANLNVLVKDVFFDKENRFRYRNKLQLPVIFNGEKTVIGFYAENSHRVIEINDCVINPTWTKNIILAFKEYFEKFNVKGYNELEHFGDVREITVREIDNNLIICVVSLRKTLKNHKELIEILKKYIKNTFSLYLNYNNSKTNVIYGNDFSLLYGEPNYNHFKNGIKYSVGVRSFSQVNDKICSDLYEYVVNNIVSNNNTTVIDAYSGTGFMTALLSKNAKKVYGIEIVKEAVDLANELVKENGLNDKITNYCGKCEEILPNLIRKENELKNEVSIVLDPPRKGCDIEVIKSIIDNDIDNIIYVSCMPSTLARDIGLIIGTLSVFGNEIKKVDNPIIKYDIVECQPFNMFPNTKHVETVCILKKKY